MIGVIILLAGMTIFGIIFHYYTEKYPRKSETENNAENR